MIVSTDSDCITINGEGMMIASGTEVIDLDFALIIVSGFQIDVLRRDGKDGCTLRMAP